MSRSLLLFPLFSLGCLSAIEGARQAPVSIVDVRPAAPIPIDAAVELTFSGPIASPPNGWPVSVARRDGRAEAIQVALLDPTHLIVRPSSVGRAPIGWRSPSALGSQGSMRPRSRSLGARSSWRPPLIR